MRNARRRASAASHYFHDRPDVLAVYTTRIEAPRRSRKSTINGNPVESGDVPGTSRHFAVWHDPFQKPSYLFAMVAGTLGTIEDRFVTMSGRGWRSPSRRARARREGRHAMDALKRSMRWDEAFGREYDLDVFMIVAVGD